MKFLALDLGMRRTGLAFYDDNVGIPLPLDTVHHTTSEELLARVKDIIMARGIDEVVIGLPRLPSGEEGAQAKIVRTFGELLSRQKITVSYQDERYTTPRKQAKDSSLQEAKPNDGDASAACTILTSYLKC